MDIKIFIIAFIFIILFFFYVLEDVISEREIEFLRKENQKLRDEVERYKKCNKSV